MYICNCIRDCVGPVNLFCTFYDCLCFLLSHFGDFSYFHLIFAKLIEWFLFTYTHYKYKHVSHSLPLSLGLQWELSVQEWGSLPGSSPWSGALEGCSRRWEQLPSSAHRPGRPDCPQWDPGPRGCIRDGQGLHVSRFAKWAHWAAREDRPRRKLYLQGSPVSEKNLVEKLIFCLYLCAWFLNFREHSLLTIATCKICLSWQLWSRTQLVWWSTSTVSTTTMLQTLPTFASPMNCSRKLLPSLRSLMSTLQLSRLVFQLYSETPLY